MWFQCGIPEFGANFELPEFGANFELPEEDSPVGIKLEIGGGASKEAENRGHRVAGRQTAQSGRTDAHRGDFRGREDRRELAALPKRAGLQIGRGNGETRGVDQRNRGRMGGNGGMSGERAAWVFAKAKGRGVCVSGTGTDGDEQNPRKSGIPGKDGVGAGKGEGGNSGENHPDVGFMHRNPAVWHYKVAECACERLHFDLGIYILDLLFWYVFLNFANKTALSQREIEFCCLLETFWNSSFWVLSLLF